VLEGEFSFTHGEQEIVLRAGDLYKVPAFQPHGVRCRERAVIAQVREPVGSSKASGQSCGCGSGCGCR
jgi:quercetin dioxygenase-like cupin family protein